MSGYPEHVIDRAAEFIPLTLYVHIPWCVRKCPYCDFNSHTTGEMLPEDDYLAALLRDLDYDLPLVGNRKIEALFIGGGTPSLCSSDFYAALLSGIQHRIPFAADAEITLEANPGTLTERYLAGLLEVGVNRLSVGVQSFDDELLPSIGRIHDSVQARAALRAAHRIGFRQLNLDLMFGLPGQGLAQARSDLETALESAPTHISYYQLTLEPGTPFGRHPPSRLPGDDRLWEMQEQGKELLEAEGFSRYEISAYCSAGNQCRHNLNYWEFGDYLGIGAGAHGKVSITPSRYIRTRKLAHPTRYQQWAGSARCGSWQEVASHADQVVEFLLNALRLVNGFPAAIYRQRTSGGDGDLERLLQPVMMAGLLDFDGAWVKPTELGLRYLDDMVAKCVEIVGC